MATFDDKSIFGNRNDSNNETSDESIVEEDSSLEEEESEMDDQNTSSAEEITSADETEDSDDTRVIGEEYVESEKTKKLREKKEKKAKRLEARQYKLMVKNHRKAMKKNPENIKRYDTDPDKGLPDEVVERRVLDDLVNTTKKGSTKSKKMIVFSNIFTFFNMLTLAIAIWLMTVSAWTDLFFFVIATANAIIGIYQELKAKKTIDRLSLLSAPTAVVIRNGVRKEINVGTVVLDDLIEVETGNQICADSVVLSGTVEVNESLLTGESNAIIKKPGDLLFSGSFVVSGKCRARVDKVGKDNYIERLSNQAKQYQKPNSELLKSLKSIIYVMAVLIIPIGICLFCLQFLSSGIEYVTAVRKTAGAMVGMIPSGLWLLTSVALFVGVIKLSQNNVLVQELYCIEMLARINVLCLDKTGTITDGTMSVKNVIDYNTLYGLTTKNIVSAMLNALHETNLTSKALEEKFGLNKRIKSVGTIPFSSQRKFNAVSFDKMGTFALGAPEFVLKTHYVKVKKEVDKYAGMGYRVLCLAHFNGVIEGQKLPNSEPEVISLILIEDNIRPDAINTINYFKESGVSVRVISGDNPLTVSKISERAGIENADQYISLDGLSDAEVERAALKYTVFGRVSPSQKKLLVTTLKAAGKKVAMTGDGVNDILALREADCSIAIASGSEAARNVSHLVLLDSNFDSMPKVVAEGRRVINNVTSVASLFLTKTIFSLLLAIQAMTNGGQYPISTNQLIMIDLFVTGLPSFFLALEPNNKEVEGNFLLNILRGALPGAITILVISLLIFGLSDGLDLDTISTQTIIAIAATHTCLMVLFKVCKPLNKLRRIVCISCYSAFLIITLLLPQFLEFRPVFGLSEYYSDDLQQEILRSIPALDISGDNYFVVDGKVINIQKAEGEKVNSILCAEPVLNEETNKYEFYYAFNTYETTEKIKEAPISFDIKGNVILGGNEVFVQYDSDDGNGFKKTPLTYEKGFNEKFTINEKGYLFYDGRAVMRTLRETDEHYNFYNKYGDSNMSKDVHICIMPTVKLEGDQLTITSVTSNLNPDTTATKTYKTDIKSLSTITIDTTTNYLLINGSPIGARLEDGTISDKKYTVELPIFSYNKNGILYVNGFDTTIAATTFKLDEAALDELVSYNLSKQDTPSEYRELPFKVLPSDAYYYLVDKDSLLVSPTVDSRTKVTLAMLGPDVTVTENGHYIINGYYTEYEAKSNVPNPRVDSNNYLILGNEVTDYKISTNDITTSKGGMVQELSLQAKIFLLMLCLLSVPLMRLLQAVVPWIKRQVTLVRKILSKF